MPNSVVTSASRSLYNLREAEVGSTSNSSLAVPSKSVLTLTIRSPGVLPAPSPHSNAHLAEECQSILSKMIALLLYQLAGKISILRPGRDRIHQGILICLNSICRVADRWVFPANKNARRKP